MCEGDRYAHLWDSKDLQRFKDNQVFWVLFQISLATTIKSQPWLSPVVYDRYKGIAAFQITMRNVQIRAHKDKSWTSLPYMVADEEVENIIMLWPPN